MRRALLAGALLLGAASVAIAAPARIEARAEKVLAKSEKSIGAAAWNALPGVRWTFVFSQDDTMGVPRRHAWDKHSGWHRVEGTNRRGQSYVIVHKLGTNEGRAWVDGLAIEGDSLGKLVTQGERLWGHDGYWLFMPFKLRDDTVVLAYDQARTEKNAKQDRLHLTFEPEGDRFWIDFDQKTGRPDYWAFFHKGASEKEAATWEGWEQHGGLWFSTKHVWDEATTLWTKDIETVTKFDPRVFSEL